MPRKKKQSKKRKKKPAIEYRYTLVDRMGAKTLETVQLKQRWNASTQTWEACDE